VKILAGCYRISLRDCVVADWLNHQIPALMYPIAIVEQVLKLRVQFQADVHVTVMFVHFARNYSCNGCAQFPNLEPIRVIHVLPKRTDSLALGRLRLGIYGYNGSQQQAPNYKEDSRHRTPLSLN